MERSARYLLQMFVIAAPGVLFGFGGIYHGLIRRRLPLKTGQVAEGSDAVLGGIAILLLGASLLYAALTLKR